MQRGPAECCSSHIESASYRPFLKPLASFRIHSMATLRLLHSNIQRLSSFHATVWFYSVACCVASPRILSPLAPIKPKASSRAQPHSARCTYSASSSVLIFPSSVQWSRSRFDVGGLNCCCWSVSSQRHAGVPHLCPGYHGSQWSQNLEFA